MATILRTVYLFAVALWLGSVVFFSLTGVVIFGAFQEASAPPNVNRPLWFPEPAAFDLSPPPDGFPNPVRLEQGSRAAGHAVGKLFPYYYGLQVTWGAMALVAALVLRAAGEGTGHGWRTALAALALLSVAGGWWLEQQVAALRVPRNELSDQVLINPAPSPDLLLRAKEARAAFGRWHGYSLIQNFVTLGLVIGLVALVPGLAAVRPRQEPAA